MPSDTPLLHENPSHRRLLATEQALVASTSPDQSYPALAPREPRTRAAICYALPFAPGLYMLWHERRNRFIRLHAAQSVVFFGAAALTQMALFLVIIVLGNLLSGAGWLTTALGLLFWAILLGLSIGGFVLWLQLLNDCVHGRVRWRPILTPLALRLEVAALRFTRSASAAYHTRRNTSQ